MHIFLGGTTLATIFYMKFNNEQAALVADEMTWHLGFKYGYRPSRYADSIQDIVGKESASKHNFAAVYGGIGFPSLHAEIANTARKKLVENPEYTGDLDKTADMVEKIFQESQGRLINDRLRFHLGFDRDQLNNGKFTYNNEEYEIKQEAVISEAKKLIKNQYKTEAFHRIFDNEGVIVGYDKENGIRGYTVDNNGRNLDFAYPFGAVGTGQEVGTKVFADIFYRMKLEERRKGFNFSDGLFILLNCFVESYDFNNKAGGYTQVFLIDARKEMFGDMTKEIQDHSGHLAAEVIRAYRWGFVERETAQSLVNRLLIAGENWEEIEKDLFKCSSSPDQLKKYLMGYKPADVPTSPLTLG
jgi:hypothetical protein